MNRCKVIECLGKPRCATCLAMDADYPPPTCAPSIEAAHAMGASGSPAVESERLAFEAWMRGHCWALCATWAGNGSGANSIPSTRHYSRHALRRRRLPSNVEFGLGAEAKG